MNNLLKASTISLAHPGTVKSKLPKAQNANLFVFRHAQTHDNIRRIFSGRRNSTITTEGVKQSELLGEKFKEIEINILMVPNLKRCKKTAQIALKSQKSLKVEIKNELLERDYGTLTGKSKIKLALKDPVLTAKYRRSWDFPPPKGESLKEVWENRIYPFCLKLQEMLHSNNVKVAICCTNNTMRLIRMYFEKLSKEEMLTLENPTAQNFASYKID